MKRILVTGGSGFIGRACVPLLVEAGYEVHAAYRHAQPEPGDGVHWHGVDLLEPDSARGLVDRVAPSHLLHLAWLSGAPEETYAAEQNRAWIAGSERLLHAFARSGSQAVIAGSSAEYDWTGGVCCERDTPLRPNSFYGTCKLECQRSLARVAANVGIRLAWARIFNAYGPFGSPQRLVPTLVRAHMQGTAARLSSCAQVRDFVHTRDVARALIALLASEAQGPVNVGSGEGVAVRVLVERVCDALGSHACAVFGARRAPEAEHAHVVASVARLREWTGFRPMIDLDHGVPETVAWWRRQLAQERE
jgi:nucleoside-diphosphate-sugar epimerase